MQLTQKLQREVGAAIRPTFLDRLMYEPADPAAGSATLDALIDDTIWVLGEIAREAAERTDPAERKDRARAITAGTIELIRHLVCMASAAGEQDLAEKMGWVAPVLERVLAETA